MKKLLFIFNPIAGKGIIKNKLYEMVDVLVKHDYEVTVYPTQAKGDAYRIMCQKLNEYDQIICSGGDGTLNEIVRTCMELNYDKPIAYIPTGTTNDFATTMKLSKKPLTCIKQIMAGNVFPCDVGSLNHHYFIYIAAFGLFSDISYTTPQTSKNILGHSAYVLEGMKHFIGMKKYNLCIECDDTVIEDTFCYGMITNSMSIGGFHFFDEKEIEINDGYFECMFVKFPNNPLDYQQTIQAMISKNITKNNRIYKCKAKKIVIHAQEEIAWTLDGEFGGCHQDITIENNKCAIKIIK